MDVSFTAILYSVAAGILPPLIWLYLMLREDKRCPEPRALIFIAFVAGMFAVVLAAFSEYTITPFLPDGLPVIFTWATIEEVLKYGVAALFILWNRAVDESLDLVIYMITVALGFAALENALFLLTPFGHGQFADGLMTDNLRFFGSTLLHVVASSAIGFALAFSYKQKRWIRALSAASGLILAIALHTLFNFFIITENGSQTIVAFFFVWAGVVVFFALFEVLKYFRYRNLPPNAC